MPIAPADFNALTIEQVRQLVPDMSEASANRPYIEGDHLQNGKAWVGPGPLEGDTDYREFLLRLERVHVSKNVVAEVCNRLVSAVVGREPRWPWVPIRQITIDQPQTDQETAAIRELEQELTYWWDVREIHKMLKRLLFRMLWGQQNVWRAYVPSGLTAGGRVTAKTLRDALNVIFVDIPEPEDGFVYVHPDTNARLGVVFFLDANGKEACEICFLDAAGRTVIKILPEEDNAADNDFRKHLTIFQVSVDTALVTEQVRQLQDALNMSLTLLAKNLNDNQFLERLFFDTLAPGRWTYEDDGQGGQVRKEFIPDPAGRGTGGRTDSFMQSVDYRNEEGKTILAPGKVVIREPLDPTGAIKGVEYWYQAMLEEVRQTHILINAAATPSGVSRDEARVDFADSGKDPELQAELAGRELLITIVAMAEAFINSPGKWTDKFKPAFKCNARYGKLSVDERKQNGEEVANGLMSEETAMSLNGIDDVDAEKSIVQRQPGWMLKLSDARAKVVTEWATEFPREVALALAGMPEDEIAKIMKQVAKVGVNEDPKTPPPAPTPAPGATPPPIPVPAAK